MSSALPAALLVSLGLLAGPGDARELADPTRPAILPPPPPSAAADGEAALTPQPPPPSAEPLQLHSILIGPRRRVAVINGRVLTRGNEIDGARITAIDPHRVLLERGGETLTLTLTLPEIKTTPDEAPPETQSP